jgi:glyoxylase-like metal-dependent hydrolase (beta-lactamase superfamily II)
MLLALVAAAAFDIVQLSEGVYAALVQPMPPMYVFANALIVVDDDGVTVVDTHQSPSAAEALLAEIRKLTDKPVRVVINTHWHGDHVYGNHAYREQFPEVIFVGHQTIREDMLELGEAMRTDELESLPASIRDRETWLSTGVGPDGTPLTDELRERIDYSRRVRTGYLEELKGLELVVPGLTFAREVTLHRPGRTIRLLHFGRAHTRGDVVVHLPEERILAVGDLVEDAFPYFGHAYPSGWADVLDAIGRIDASVILPSHGPVLLDRELVDLETSMMRTLVDEVGRAVAAGKTLEQTQAEVTLSEFIAHFPGSGEGVAAAVERAYREASGQLAR